MTLCDTGPLVALIDAGDQNHTRSVAALSVLPAEPLLTTWPCLAEAMHLLWRAAKSAGQDELWKLIADDLVRLHAVEELEWQRIRALMRQYADTPMDLADASLVSAAERLGLRRIFTFDSHFRVYLIYDSDAFEIAP